MLLSFVVVLAWRFSLSCQAAKLLPKTFSHQLWGDFYSNTNCARNIPFVYFGTFWPYFYFKVFITWQFPFAGDSRSCDWFGLPQIIRYIKFARLICAFHLKSWKCQANKYSLANQAFKLMAIKSLSFLCFSINTMKFLWKLYGKTR